MEVPQEVGSSQTAMSVAVPFINILDRRTCLSRTQGEQFQGDTRNNNRYDGERRMKRTAKTLGYGYGQGGKSSFPLISRFQYFLQFSLPLNTILHPPLKIYFLGYKHQCTVCTFPQLNTVFTHSQGKNLRESITAICTSLSVVS